MKLGTLQNAQFRGFRAGAVRSGALLLLSAVSLSLAACGDAAEETGAGGLNPQDAEALDEAAAKLDAENAAVPAIAPAQASAQPAEPTSPATTEQKAVPQDSKVAAPKADPTN